MVVKEELVVLKRENENIVLVERSLESVVGVKIVFIRESIMIVRIS